MTPDEVEKRLLEVQVLEAACDKYYAENKPKIAELLKKIGDLVTKTKATNIEVFIAAAMMLDSITKQATNVGQMKYEDMLGVLAMRKGLPFALGENEIARGREPGEKPKEPMH